MLAVIPCNCVPAGLTPGIEPCMSLTLFSFFVRFFLHFCFTIYPFCITVHTSDWKTGGKFLLREGSWVVPWTIRICVKIHLINSLKMPLRRQVPFSNFSHHFVQSFLFDKIERLETELGLLDWFVCFLYCSIAGGDGSVISKPFSQIFGALFVYLHWVFIRCQPYAMNLCPWGIIFS